MEETRDFLIPCEACPASVFLGSPSSLTRFRSCLSFNPKNPSKTPNPQIQIAEFFLCFLPFFSCFLGEGRIGEGRGCGDKVLGLPVSSLSPEARGVGGRHGRKRLSSTAWIHAFPDELTAVLGTLPSPVKKKISSPALSSPSFLLSGIHSVCLPLCLVPSFSCCFFFFLFGVSLSTIYFLFFPLELSMSFCLGFSLPHCLCFFLPSLCFCLSWVLIHI